MPVSHDSVDIQVDVPPLSSVGTQGKPHGISTTLRYAIRVVCFLEGETDRDAILCVTVNYLSLFGAVNLLGIKIALS